MGGGGTEGRNRKWFIFYGLQRRWRKAKNTRVKKKKRTPFCILGKIKNGSHKPKHNTRVKREFPQIKKKIA